MIVVAHRPWPLRPAMDAMRRSLIGRGTSVPLDLGPLADERHPAAGAAGPSRDDQVLLERVVKLAGGNPFAAVELARDSPGRPTTAPARWARWCSAASATTRPTR